MQSFKFARLFAISVTALLLSSQAHSACIDQAQSFVDWRGCVKRSENLAGAPLPQANLENIDFEMAYLAGANLEMAHLTNAKLGYANLERANLRGADLWRADMHGAILTGALLGGAIWTDGRRCAPDSIGGCK